MSLTRSLSPIYPIHIPEQAILKTPIAPSPMPPIPAQAIAEYVSLRAELETLRSRLLSLEREHPGIVHYFAERVRLVNPSDEQMLFNLHVVISSDREIEARTTEAIDRMQMDEDEAVMLLARRFWECGDIEEAIASLG